MGSREELRQLVDALPEREVFVALRFIQFLKHAPGTADPLTRALLTAPEEKDELTADEIRALEAAVEQAIRGEVVPWEDVRQRLG